MKSRIISSLSVMAILSAAAFPALASAQVGVSAGVNANVNAGAHGQLSQAALKDRMLKLPERTSAEISGRVEDLIKLQSRIQGMKNLSDSQKASFAATIQTQIAALNALAAKIKTDTSTTTLRADIQSIGPAYRIYMLIHPQLAILAAGDRITTIVGMLQALGTKFDARLAAHANADASVKLAELRAKIADASVQEQAAVTGVINLQPDQGNKTIMDSNTAAIKAARIKIQAAMKDVRTAFGDARAIAQLLRASGSVTATSSASTSNH